MEAIPVELKGEYNWVNLNLLDGETMKKVADLLKEHYSVEHEGFKTCYD